MIRPFPLSKRPLKSTTVFMENNNHVSHFHINSTSGENQSVVEQSEIEPSLPNGIISDNRTVSANQSADMLLIAEAVDSSKVVPFIEHEQNGVSSTPSSRDSSGKMSRRSQRLPNGMKTGIKSVLKTGHPADHMLANRPIKTVTFVESVTVVTVM